jgi:hypothetical protein
VDVLRIAPSLRIKSAQSGFSDVLMGMNSPFESNVCWLSESFKRSGKATRIIVKWLWIREEVAENIFPSISGW